MRPRAHCCISSAAYLPAQVVQSGFLGDVELTPDAHAFMHTAARPGDAPRAARLSVPPASDASPCAGQSDAGSSVVGRAEASSALKGRHAPPLTSLNGVPVNGVEALFPRSHFRGPGGAGGRSGGGGGGQQQRQRADAMPRGDDNRAREDQAWRLSVPRPLSPSPGLAFRFWLRCTPAAKSSNAG